MRSNVDTIVGDRVLLFVLFVGIWGGAITMVLSSGNGHGLPPMGFLVFLGVAACIYVLYRAVRLVASLRQTIYEQISRLARLGALAKSYSPSLLWILTSLAVVWINGALYGQVFSRPDASSALIITALVSTLMAIIAIWGGFAQVARTQRVMIENETAAILHSAGRRGR